MPHHRLGLSRARTVRGVWALLALAPLAGAPVLAQGAFSATAPSFTIVASAARFDATVSPTPTVSRRGRNIWIAWPAITISSGRPVTYTVVRHGSGQSVETVCLTTDPTPAAGTVIECRDFKPGTGATYRVEAFVTGPDGAPTWSLPASDTVGM